MGPYEGVKDPNDKWDTLPVEYKINSGSENLFKYDPKTHSFKTLSSGIFKVCYCVIGQSIAKTARVTVGAVLATADSKSGEMIDPFWASISSSYVRGFKGNNEMLLQGSDTLSLEKGQHIKLFWREASIGNPNLKIDAEKSSFSIIK